MYHPQDAIINVQDSTASGRRKLSEFRTESIHYVGSYGNSLNATVNDGSFDQDYLGGLLVNPNYPDRVLLVGNAWKAFQLPTSYPVTKNTMIKFDFTIFREAQGHAICLDDNRNEDTFGGTRIRCLMLGGKQFSVWEHVKKINLAELKKGEASQSSSLQGGGASKAVDGNINQVWNKIPQINSVSCTASGIQSWWQFEFKGNDDGDEYDISEIVLYSAYGCPSCEDLVNFRVTICGLATDSPSSSPSETPSTSDVSSIPPSSFPTQSPSAWPDACEGTGYNRIGDDVRYGGTVNQDGIVRIPVNKRGAVIRIVLEGENPRTLALGEVQVLGAFTEGIPVEIDVNVFDLFQAQDAPEVNFIGFVQDDDEFPKTGPPPHDEAVMSEFSNIVLYESDDYNSDQLVSYHSIFITVLFAIYRNVSLYVPST